MSSNPTPDNNDILRALADRLADGCHTHEATIGILHYTEAVIRAGIAGLSAAEFQVGLKKKAVDDAYDALQTADNAGRVVLTACRLRLMGKLGKTWNAAWEPTGFPHQSTAVPRTADERFTLLDDLKTYFTATPANEGGRHGRDRRGVPRGVDGALRCPAGRGGCGLGADRRFQRAARCGGRAAQAGARAH